ncbi:TMEM165/GDT1 family protein [Thermococcus sp. 21S9]|uniref:TMEM165/GDT1 family protein n=1 Tax=Thermococcus sp. 21S9 TaxID=1638223 RepID=UPI00143C5526|nr:TMEM165/GDT1 family protein [Thermococcus sp. 21S9]NJE53967.1 TMEM165/GDT1 family protein [Thermococcus sp. 21S9]
MENILTVFLAIFLAELGDKTQLTTIAFASKYGWKTAFIGAILGLAAVNLIGALLGDAIGDVLPMDLIQRGAGVLFIVFGVLMLLGKL